MWEKCHNSFQLKLIIDIDHSQLQQSKLRTTLNLPVMPKTILKYKCQTPKYLLTCLWCQMPYSKLYICLWCQRPNRSANAIPKSTSTPVCDAKDQTDVQIHTREQFSICLWCQRPYSSTNTRSKNTPQPACDAKTILGYQKNAIPMNTTTSLWCQRSFSIAKAKIKNNSELLYLPLLPNTKLKCKCHTQDDFYPCLWCQRPYSSTNARTKKIPFDLSVMSKP